jgi:hypothetical protein
MLSGFVLNVGEMTGKLASHTVRNPIIVKTTWILISVADFRTDFEG